MTADEAGHRSTSIARSIDKMRAEKGAYFHEHVIEHIPVADHQRVLTDGVIDINKLQKYLNKNEKVRKKIEAEYTFPDGTNARMYMGDSVKNGAAGTHAEVLAANDVLRFTTLLVDALSLGSIAPAF